MINGARCSSSLGQVMTSSFGSYVSGLAFRCVVRARAFALVRLVIINSRRVKMLNRN